MFDKVFTATKQLSDNLQSSSINLSHATELVVATMDYRYLDKVYDHATRIAKNHDIPIEVPRRRRTITPARLNDSIVYETLGQQEIGNSLPKQEFKTQFYYPVLDKFQCELKRRFIYFIYLYFTGRGKKADKEITREIRVQRGALKEHLELVQVPREIKGGNRKNRTSGTRTYRMK